MRKTPAVLGIPALLVLAACSSTSTGHHPFQPTTAPAVTPTTKPTPKPAFAVTTSATAQLFTTPDGNIGCDVESAYARCDPARRSWSLPPQPSDCASGWGHGIEMQLGSKASFFCGSDSVRGSTRVLAPGHGLKVGFVECDVVTAGQVTCKSSSDQHGFTISRASYALR